MRLPLKAHTRLSSRRVDGEYSTTQPSPLHHINRNLITSFHRFLLHYTARDAIDVLSSGARGLAEMREVAEIHYNDDSGAIPTPLFGMVQFRRRKVLIKLVLEGTSRLIQGSH